MPTAKELEEISKLALRQLQLEQAIAKLTADLEVLNKDLKTVSEVSLPEAMAAAGGMKSFGLNNGLTLVIKDEVRASMKSGQEAEAVKWLDDNKLDVTPTQTDIDLVLDNATNNLLQPQ